MLGIERKHRQVFAAEDAGGGRREVKGEVKEITISEDLASRDEKRVETAKEIKRLAEKIATVVASENATINVAECALIEAREIMRTRTVANFTCQ